MSSVPPSAARVLVAPVDWGIGHATRTVVIIRALLKSGAVVEAASAGRALGVLRSAFPNLVVHEIPGYAIRYPTGRMSIDLALQMPRVLRLIRSEGLVARRLVDERDIDLVISDGRFGFRVPDRPSVLVTHQLNIQGGWPFSRYIANTLNKRYARRFDRCWIPDHADRPLSGALSGSHETLVCEFVGPLSGLDPSVAHSAQTDPIDVLAIMSGPEPGRTRFERAVLRQARATVMKTVIVRGIPDGHGANGHTDPDHGGPTDSRAGGTTPNVRVISWAGPTELAQLLRRARVVVSRSGYSTIMDLDRLGGKAVFVPTPGQTEQAYLARRSAEAGHAVVRRESRLDLAGAFADAGEIAGFTPRPTSGVLDIAVQRVLRQSLEARSRRRSRNQSPDSRS